MVNKTKVYFRADGNAEIGLGHVYRSLALAEMISQEFECHFLIRSPSDPIRIMIDKICHTCSILEDKNYLDEAEFISKEVLAIGDIIVLDGYKFVTDYQKTIKNNGFKLVCIDDIYSYHFVADVIINHAGGITRNQYSCEDYTQCYFGLPYALLREPFRLAAQKKKPKTLENGSVFVCLGGADPHNDTLKVLTKCFADPSVEKCYLVLGSAYNHTKELNAFISKRELNIEVLRNLDADMMVEYMRRSSKAITPPSSISYEYLAVGGDLYLKIIADNQKNIYRYFVESGLAFSYDSYNARMINLSRISDGIDGLSGKRFLKIFKSLNS